MIRTMATTTVMCQVCGLYPATHFVDYGVVDLGLMCAECADDECAVEDDEMVCRNDALRLEDDSVVVDAHVGRVELLREVSHVV